MRGEYGVSDHPYSFSSRVWWRYDGCIGYVFEYANMKAGFGQGGLSFSGGGYEPWIGWNVTQPAAMSLNVVINIGTFATVQNQTYQNPSYSIDRRLSKR